MRNAMTSGYAQHREMYDFIREWYNKTHGRDPSTLLSIVLCDFGIALNERSNSRTEQHEG